MVARLKALGLPGVTARTFHAHALSQLRHFWPDTPRRRAAARPARFEAAAARAARPRAARALSIHAGQGHRRRDRVGQEPPAHAHDVPGRDRRQSHRPVARAARPGRPVRAHVRRLRAREGARRADRFRRPARRHRGPPRERRRRGRDRSRAEALVQRRRVPGHEPAPGAAARAVGRRARGRVRRRRRGPDDLHVHRRDERLPDHVRRRGTRGRTS